MAVENLHITSAEVSLPTFWADAEHGQRSILNQSGSAWNEFWSWKNQAGTRAVIGAVQGYTTNGTSFAAYYDNSFKDVTSFGTIYPSEYIRRQAGTDDYIRLQNATITLAVTGAVGLTIAEASGVVTSTFGGPVKFADVTDGRVAGFATSGTLGDTPMRYTATQMAIGGAVSATATALFRVANSAASCQAFVDAITSSGSAAATIAARSITTGEAVAGQTWLGAWNASSTGSILGLLQAGLSAVVLQPAGTLAGVGTSVAASLALSTNNVVRMTISASAATVGIGAVPISTWATGFQVMQVGDYASLCHTGTGIDSILLTQNQFFDTAWKGIATGGASRINMDAAGAIAFSSNSSVVASTAFTPNNSMVIQGLRVGVGAESNAGWSSTVRTLQVGLYTSLTHDGTTMSAGVLSHNCYYDGSAWKGVAAGGSCQVLLQPTGAIVFRTAPTVTVGGTFTPNVRMTISASAAAVGIGTDPDATASLKLASIPAAADTDAGGMLFEHDGVVSKWGTVAQSSGITTMSVGSENIAFEENVLTINATNDINLSAPYVFVEKIFSALGTVLLQATVDGTTGGPVGTPKSVGVTDKNTVKVSPAGSIDLYYTLTGGTEDQVVHVRNAGSTYAVVSGFTVQAGALGVFFYDGTSWYAAVS